MASRPSYIYQSCRARENKRTKANNGEISLFVVCMVILTVTLLYLESVQQNHPSDTIKFYRTSKRKVTLELKCIANYKFSTL